MKICNGYLRYELELLKPEVIIPLGNTSLTALTLITEVKYGNISKIVGEKFEWNGTLIFPQFHPAAILRDIKRLDKFNNVFVEIVKILKN
jgi:DNA polymerase